MSLWHVEECRCTQLRCNPPQPPLIEPSTTEPYYTMSVWHVEECRHTQLRCTHPTNQTQWKRAVLHHVSLICGRMQVYLGQMYPPGLIKPSATEPYYTMSVWHVEVCRCTQVRCTLPPLSAPSATEPYYSMLVWHVEECICTHIICTLPPAHQSYYYAALLHHVSSTFRRLQTYPGQMYPLPTNQT